MESSILKIQGKWPTFNGVAEAKQWFQKTFSSRFIERGSGVINDEKIYFFHLITDPRNYWKGTKKLLEGGVVSGFELAVSYYIVGILEDGRVHVIY